MKKSKARILIEDFEENQKALDQLLKAYGNMVTKIKDQDNTKYFKDDQDKIQKAQKLLAESKYNLDIHPLVKQYNKAYLEVKLMYEEINKQLFYIFRTHHKNCEN